MFQTEHEFTLPMGYLDEDGTLAPRRVMRLATAADEILPLRDPRVQQNPAYLTVILLSRVVTRLGPPSGTSRRRRSRACSRPTWRTCRTSTTRSTAWTAARRRVTCPECAHEFEVERPCGGIVNGYPLDQLHRGGSVHRLPLPLARRRRSSDSSTPTAAAGLQEISAINQRVNDSAEDG